MTTALPQPIDIRRASAADISALAALEQQVFATVVYPEFFFRQAHDLWPDFLLLAWQGDSLLGYLLAAPGQQGLTRISILSLAVSAQSRGQGIGRQLLQHFLACCPKETAQLWLTVAPDNLVAVQLYEKLGFVVQKYAENYYGPDEHRLLMVQNRPVQCGQN